MKRTITLLIATALIFGMSQCKKNVETITPSNLGEAVHITLNVGDGDKHNVNPGTGVVEFTENDVIYVGNNNHYIGSLTYTSNNVFTGTIYGPSTSDYLHFYFVGGLTPSATPVAGTTTDFTVNIANQSEKLPVLSYGHSTQHYVDGTIVYNCTLANKCGLVKFVPATATPGTVRVGGMKTTATIDFANPGITPTDATGKVTLFAENNAAKWAILLVQDEVSTPTVTIAGYNSTIASVPPVIENMYYTTGVSIAMSLAPAPTGAAGGTANARLFSVSADDKHVWFSKGNLQAVFSSTTTCTWRFATNQYDYIGDAIANTKVGNNLVTTSGTVDLFGWVGAYSSYAAYGINYSTANSYYGNNANESLKADWGHNPISNGGNKADLWRTLTVDEWVWVLGPDNGANPGTNCRTSSTVNNVQNARFAKATVCSRVGVIIFPDNYTHPSGVTQPTNINGYTSDFTGNSYNTTQWSSMEAAGCVFLPAAGNRNGTTVSDVGSKGHYWSSASHESNTYSAYSMYFHSSNLYPQFYDNRCNGYSVRLVCQVEE